MASQNRVALNAIWRSLGGLAGAALLLSSALVALWLSVFGEFVFFVDSTVFFENADSLLRLWPGNYHFAPGYPLLIALTGFPWTGSLWPLVLVQATFAAIIPWLAFKTFAVFDRTAGIAAGFVCLVTLTPFFFQNTFFHEEMFLFFGFLSIALASLFFANRRPKFIYFSLASASIAYFTQPAVIGFVVGCAGAFTLFVLYHRMTLKHVAAALGIFIVLTIAFSKLQDLRHHVHRAHIGRQLFFNTYLRSAPYGGFDISTPAGAELRRQLLAFFAESFAGSAFNDALPFIEARIGDDYQELFGQYVGRSAELVDRMFARPNKEYFEVFYDLPDKYPGAFSDELFFRASLSYIYRHPIIAFRYTLGNFVDLTIGRPWSCVGRAPFPNCRARENISFYPAELHQVVLTSGRMPDRAYNFLISRIAPGALVQSADIFWRQNYRKLQILSLTFMFLGWVASVWKAARSRWTLGAFVVAYVSNVLVFSFLVEPQFRYQVTTIAMCAFAAGAGIYVLLPSRFIMSDKKAVQAQIAISTF